MTRINTNISSLVAQSRLNRTNDELQISLTRLSTGLRINTGKDDPAGLIASEALRSDITSINKAISNTQRAVQIIATADSALGQVSSLLNTMRGLIVEAANTGAISDDEIAANQLQIDSSLEAINRISQTTSFQGRKLLDGSLDFVSDVETLTPVVDAKIDQANLGTSGTMNVEVVVQSAATQAQLTNSAFPLTNANSVVRFPVRSSTVLTDISVTAAEVTDQVSIVFEHDPSVAADQVEASYDVDTQTITVSGNEAVIGTITKAQVASAINSLVGFDAQAATGTALDPAGDFTLAGPPPASATLGESSISFEAVQPGLDFNNVEVLLQTGASNSAVYDANTKTLTVTYVNGTATVADIANAIDGTAEFLVTTTGGGSAVANANDANIETNTGVTGGGVLQDNLVFELQGSQGAETFNFQTGTSNLHIAAAINQVSDATGVTALVDALTGDIELNSSTYGKKSLVAVNIITEGANGIFRNNLSGIRNTGTDIVARVNGIGADGDGNQLSISTSTLTLQLTLDPDQPVNSLDFNITGGGALFQLGGDVVTNQQARMGIGSVSTSTLGGPSGRLYELGSGQNKALARDIHGAGQVIQEVINKVTSLRGRLGAFQATTLDSNLVSLNDTVGNLTEAESLIRDADFAKETARLTRAQILVQSGTAVLGISNQNPQNVLRLLQ